MCKDDNISIPVYGISETMISSIKLDLAVPHQNDKAYKE